MAKTAQITFVEFDLRQKGPTHDTWVTVTWGVDDEMEVHVGKTNPRDFDRSTLAELAEKALKEMAPVIAKTTVE